MLFFKRKEKQSNNLWLGNKLLQLANVMLKVGFVI